jgi:hypothetical protein
MPDLLPSAPQLALIGCMMAIIFVLWRRAREAFDRERDREEAKPAPRVNQVAAAEELTRWRLEMHEMARDVKGEIDTKLALLQILIRQANDAAGRLDKSIARARQLGLAGPRDPLALVEAWERRAADDVEHDDDESAPAAGHPQSQRIYALADAGRGVADIASETGLPLGEIEMTLSLR